MHYFAHVFGKDNPFTFRFVDDNLDIIGGVTKYFRKNRYLMPENCSLECMYMSSNYDHYPPEYKAGKPIKGTGPLHESYRDMASKIARNVSASCAEYDDAAKTLMIKKLFCTWNSTNEEYSSDDELESVGGAAKEDTSTTNREELRFSTVSQLQLVRPAARPATLLFSMQKLVQEDDTDEDFDSLSATAVLPSLTGSRTTP